MDAQIIGIDHGNAELKTHTGFQCPAGFTRLQEESITPQRVLQYDSHYYAIGAERFALKPDKTKDEDTFLLTLAAIAESLKQQNQHHAPIPDIVLAVGLPVVRYGRLKEAFRNYFIRDNVSFRYQEVDHTLRIPACYVFPQSYAALLTRFHDYKSLPDCNVVDIGGGTTDCFRMEYGRIHIASCFSLPVGVIHLIHQVLQQTIAEGYQLTETQVKQMILGQQPMFQDERLVPLVQALTQPFVEKLLAQITEHGLELRLNPTVFVGGGSILLQNYLQQQNRYLGYHEVMGDTFSNAKGFALLAKQKRMQT